MTTLGNRIHVRGEFQYDEQVANSANIYPGMLIALQTNGKVDVNNVAGGRYLPVFAIEDAETGPSLFVNGTGQTVTTAYASGALVPNIAPTPGSVINARLLDGFSYTVGEKLIADNAGNLKPFSAVTSTDVPGDEIAEVFDSAIDLTVSGHAPTLHPVRIL